jgi:hypothetical protein
VRIGELRLVGPHWCDPVEPAYLIHDVQRLTLKDAERRLHGRDLALQILPPGRLEGRRGGYSGRETVGKSLKLGQ